MLECCNVILFDHRNTNAQFIGSDVQFTHFEDDSMTEYEEPKKPSVKIISNGKPKGSRGRPKKK